MFRKSLVVIILYLSVSISAYGSFYSPSYDTAGSIAATIEIEGKGVFNLVVSVQFLRNPYDRGESDSDEYEELINRLSVEWKSAALRRILESNTYRLGELSALKAGIEEEIQTLIKQSKPKHRVREGAEVIFTIGNFYILEPRVD